MDTVLGFVVAAVVEHAVAAPFAAAFFVAAVDTGWVADDEPPPPLQPVPGHVPEPGHELDVVVAAVAAVVALAWHLQPPWEWLAWLADWESFSRRHW